jgi:hypothetical protein
MLGGIAPGLAAARAVDAAGKVLCKGCAVKHGEGARLKPQQASDCLVLQNLSCRLA